MTEKSLFLSGIDELKNKVAELDMPAFRAKQISEWIFKKFVFSFDEMTNLPVSDRQKLKEAFPKILPPVEKYELDSVDQTGKAVIKLADGELIESVAIPSEDSMTFCLSTQVGCGIDCAFCRTGKQGFKRNLTTEEIILQVMLLIKKCGKKPTNIVFMGMGEPFANRKAVFASIDLLTDKNGLGLATRRITISTSGIVDGIKELAERPGEVNLAVSLHVADNTSRNTLVPINKKYNVEKLREAVIEYCQRTNRRVTLEVTLLKGINDQYNDAVNLANFCEGLLVHVNIVRFNRFKGSCYEQSPEKNEKEFKKILKKAGIPVTVRASRGQRIMAACGQLAGKANEQEKK